MASFRLMLLLQACLLTLFGFSIAAPTVDSVIRVRNAPGQTDADTYRMLGIALRDAAALEKRDQKTWSASKLLDASWQDIPLLKVNVGATLTPKGQTAQPNSTTSPKPGDSLALKASVNVACKTCYIKGNASLELSVSSDRNIGSLVHETVDAFKDATSDLLDAAKGKIVDYIKAVINNTRDGIDLTDFVPPQKFVPKLDIDVPSIPNTDVKFGLRNFDMYVELDSQLSASATYTIPLFHSKTPLGVDLGKGLSFGTVFSVDLMLSVNGTLDLNSGFHLKVDELAMNLALFGSDVTNITQNGSKFEFLPVKVISGGIELAAVLRLGVRASLELAASNIIEKIAEKIDDALGDEADVAKQNTTSTPDFEIGAGVYAGVFADVAKFTVGVQYNSKSTLCPWRVYESFAFAVGANAGAYAQLGHHEWRKSPNKTVDVHTAKIEVCGETKLPSAATVTAPVILRRQAASMTTTVATTVYTFTDMGCNVPGVIDNCPASQQRTSVSKSTQTTTAIVTKGSKYTWPAVQATVTATRSFGDKAVTIPASAGVPSAYTAPPEAAPTITQIPTAAQIEDDVRNRLSGLEALLYGDVNGVSKKVIFGVSVGVGGAIVLLALVSCILCCCRRRRGGGSNKTVIERTYVYNNNTRTDMSANNSRPDMTGRSPSIPSTYSSPNMLSKSPHVQAQAF